MSAITGIGDSTTIRSRARTSSSRGTAQRTRSPPASATAWIWRMVASKSAVSVLVIDWTATGAPPPILTPPTSICRFEGIPGLRVSAQYPIQVRMSLQAVLARISEIQGALAPVQPAQTTTPAAPAAGDSSAFANQLQSAMTGTSGAAAAPADAAAGAAPTFGKAAPGTYPHLDGDLDAS